MYVCQVLGRFLMVLLGIWYKTVEKCRKNKTGGIILAYLLHLRLSHNETAFWKVANDKNKRNTGEADKNPITDQSYSLYQYAVFQEERKTRGLI